LPFEENVVSIVAVIGLATTLLLFNLKRFLDVKKPVKQSLMHIGFGEPTEAEKELRRIYKIRYRNKLILYYLFLLIPIILSILCYVFLLKMDIQSSLIILFLTYLSTVVSSIYQKEMKGKN